jgi:hypothetical protein
VLKNRAALVEQLHSEPIDDKRPYLFGKAGLEIGVQIGCSKSSSGLLRALNQVIRAAIFQVITSETYSEPWFRMPGEEPEITGRISSWEPRLIGQIAQPSIWHYGDTRVNER